MTFNDMIKSQRVSKVLDGSSLSVYSLDAIMEESENAKQHLDGFLRCINGMYTGDPDVRASKYNDAMIFLSELEESIRKFRLESTLEERL